MKEGTLVFFFPLYLLGSVAHRRTFHPEKQTLPPAQGMAPWFICWRHGHNLQESGTEECETKKTKNKSPRGRWGRNRHFNFYWYSICFRGRMTLFFFGHAFLEVIRLGCLSQPGTLGGLHTVCLWERDGGMMEYHCLLNRPSPSQV